MYEQLPAIDEELPTLAPDAGPPSSQPGALMTYGVALIFELIFQNILPEFVHEVLGTYRYFKNI